MDPIADLFCSNCKEKIGDWSYFKAMSFNELEELFFGKKRRLSSFENDDGAGIKMGVAAEKPSIEAGIAMEKPKSNHNMAMEKPKPNNNMKMEKPKPNHNMAMEKPKPDEKPSKYNMPAEKPGNSSKYVPAHGRISSIIKSTIEERKKEKSENPTHGKNDMLEKLLYLDTLSLDEKVSFALDCLISGYEKTSKILSLMVHFLSQTPGALEKLKLEHKNIRGMKKDDVSLTLEDIKKMEFTQNVINETIRYGNTVQYLNRKAISDVRYKDYVIPSGWQVLPVFSAVHLDNSLHANASQFDPWRWEDQEQKSKNFFPFGGGVRYCPGSEAGKIELAVFLHHLVHNSRWKAEDVDQPIAYPYVDFQKGLPLTVESINKTDQAQEKWSDMMR